GRVFERGRLALLLDLGLIVEMERATPLLADERDGLLFLVHGPQFAAERIRPRGLGCRFRRLGLVRGVGLGGCSEGSGEERGGEENRKIQTSIGVFLHKYFPL